MCVWGSTWPAMMLQPAVCVLAADKYISDLLPNQLTRLAVRAHAMQAYACVMHVSMCFDHASYVSHCGLLATFRCSCYADAMHVLRIGCSVFCFSSVYVLCVVASSSLAGINLQDAIKMIIVAFQGPRRGS